MDNLSINELKLELLNVLLDLIGFEGEEYSSIINKAKTIEDLDQILNLIVTKQKNSEFEKKIVMFWRKIR